MNVIPMNESHVEQIAELEKRCFSYPWDAASIRGELSNELSLWLVAEENGCVLGYIGSQTVMGESDILNIAVREEYRRRGIGRILLEALCTNLAARDSSCIILEVRASNEAAKALYLSQGFRMIAVRPRYYSRPVEDAELYRKELKQ